MKLLLVGKHALESNIRFTMLAILRDIFSRNCISPKGSCNFDVSATCGFGRMFGSLDVNDFKSRMVAELYLEDVCVPCRDIITTDTDHHRQLFWNKIPRVFGLPPWDARAKP